MLPRTHAATPQADRFRAHAQLILSDDYEHSPAAVLWAKRLLRDFDSVPHEVQKDAQQTHFTLSELSLGAGEVVRI